jgi:hypothetical protein
VLFVVIALLPTRTVYKAFKPILQMHNTEVYKQAEGFTTEFEVRKELGVMDRADCVDGLDFYHHKVFHNQVHPVCGA